MKRLLILAMIWFPTQTMAAKEGSCETRAESGTDKNLEHNVGSRTTRAENGYEVKRSDSVGSRATRAENGTRSTGDHRAYSLNRPHNNKHRKGH